MINRVMSFSLGFRKDDIITERGFYVRYDSGEVEEPKDVAINHCMNKWEHLKDFGMPVFRTFRCLHDRKLDDLGMR